jgi:hypothetical protein
MKRALAMLLITLASGFGYGASTAYFTRTRTVSIGAPDRQNYIVVDADIWKYARPDLFDLRLYDGNQLVPHALTTRAGGVSHEEVPAKLLNLGEVGGHVEFDVDMGSVPEYDRVRMEIDAKNFVNTARVEGRQSLNDRSGVNLGASTLYDFTNESLGTNSVLKFPPASFPYLHIRLSPGIRADQVKAAFVSNVAETKTAWSQAGTCVARSSSSKQSVFDCAILPGAPVERIRFTLPGTAVNFNRTVVVGDEEGEFARDAISRVRVSRAGKNIVSEHLSVDLYRQPRERITVTVENGDDLPLPIGQVELLSVERRLYFDPHGKTELRLYYGDAKLEAASYDYQKVFQQSPAAALAQLGPGEANPQFTGRPDDRPWSERHSALLWLAMLIAIGVLGALALRGLKSRPAR